MTKKQFLFINRQTPYGSATAHESLEVALATGAYEQTIHLLFIDDGIWQLSKRQQPQKIGYKQYAASFKALDLYHIEHVYVDEESLATRGLTEDELLIPVTKIERKAIQQLIEQADVVLSF